MMRLRHTCLVAYVRDRTLEAFPRRVGHVRDGARLNDFFACVRASAQAQGTIMTP
jgi:hypothetical protein